MTTETVDSGYMVRIVKVWTHIGVLVCWLRDHHVFGPWQENERTVPGVERFCQTCGLMERHEYR